MVEQAPPSRGIIIKKETMIKKNNHDINDVYNMEKGVSFNAMPFRI